MLLICSCSDMKLRLTTFPYQWKIVPICKSTQIKHYATPATATCTGRVKNGDKIMERQPDEQSQECDIISLIFNLLYDFEMAFCDILHEKQLKTVPNCNVQSHILVIVHLAVCL